MLAAVRVRFWQLPAKQAATQLGMCLTSLKKVCRTHGIMRWPHRRLKMIDRKISGLKSSMEGSAQQKTVIQQQLMQLHSARRALPNNTPETLLVEQHDALVAVAVPSEQSEPSSPLSIASTTVAFSDDALDVGSDSKGPLDANAATEAAAVPEEEAIDSKHGALRESTNGLEGAGSAELCSHTNRPKKHELASISGPSDEEMIALLAGCAAAPMALENASEDGGGAASGAASLSDDDLVAALAADAVALVCGTGESERREPAFADHSLHLEVERPACLVACGEDTWQDATGHQEGYVLDMSMALFDGYE